VQLDEELHVLQLLQLWQIPVVELDDVNVVFGQVSKQDEP
jgi:hypothetical protein